MSEITGRSAADTSHRIQIEEFPDAAPLERPRPRSWGSGVVVTLALVGGIVCMAIAIAITGSRVNPTEFGTRWEDVPTIVPVTLNIVGALAIGYWLLHRYGLKYLVVAARDRAYHGQAKAIIAARASTDASWMKRTLYVELIPRANWERQTGEYAVDFGFVNIDTSKEVIVFEGVRRRLTIPLRALTRVELDFVLRRDEDGVRSVIDLSADDGETQLEAPLSPNQAPWRTDARARANLAIRFGAQIASAYAAMRTLHASGVDPIASWRESGDMLTRRILQRTLDCYDEHQGDDDEAD
ncbi:MAG: hypothetical protein KDA33_13345 [Phycisphaerales bacterium]|nr:hypothetical protein [Phycisphaerales bacterium]